MNPDLIAKYKKVQSLVTGGATPAERETARKILKQMERQYPGIAAASAPPPQAPPPPQGMDPWSWVRAQAGHMGLDFDQVFNHINGAAEFLGRMGEELRVDRERDDTIEEGIDVSVKATQRGKVTVSAVFDVRDLADWIELCGGGEVGKQEFAHRFGAIVAKALTDAMEG